MELSPRPAHLFFAPYRAPARFAKEGRGDGKTSSSSPSIFSSSPPSPPPPSPAFPTPPPPFSVEALAAALSLREAARSAVVASLFFCTG